MGKMVLARLMESDTFGGSICSGLDTRKEITTKEQRISGTHPCFIPR